jgi:hypothetical protein
MADNVAITAGTGTTIAADDVGGGVLHQRVKLTWGVDGTGTDASASNPLPVVQTGTHNIGTVTTVTTVAAVTAISNALPAGNNNIGDVDVATLPALTRFVTMTMTVPSDAQDAGDVIAATQIVAACTPANDVPGVLHSATLIDTDDVGVNIKAVFFSANTALGTEDSAPDIDDTEALTVLGIVDFAAADYVDLGGSKYNTKTNIGLAVVPATGTDDIYMALYSPTGGTWSSQAITVRLGFI